MRKLPSTEFWNLIEAGHESRRIEFKSPFSWNDDKALWLCEKTIQTILGLTNTRDGGDIVIGINEKDDKGLDLVGLSKEQVSSFNYDLLKGTVDSFASSSCNFDVAEDQNEQFIVIRVSEFEEIPTICKKDGHNKELLRRGDIYCRSSSGPPATIRVTETEMREIIELAIDKGQRKLMRRGYIHERAENSEDLFRQQRKDLE